MLTLTYQLFFPPISRQCVVWKILRSIVSLNGKSLILRLVRFPERIIWHLMAPGILAHLRFLLVWTLDLARSGVFVVHWRRPLSLKPDLSVFILEGFFSVPLAVALLSLLNSQMPLAFNQLCEAKWRHLEKTSEVFLPTTLKLQMKNLKSKEDSDQVSCF